MKIGEIAADLIALDAMTTADEAQIKLLQELRKCEDEISAIRQKQVALHLRQSMIDAEMTEKKRAATDFAVSLEKKYGFPLAVMRMAVFSFAEDEGYLVNTPDAAPVEMVGRMPANPDLRCGKLGHGAGKCPRPCALPIGHVGECECKITAMGIGHDDA